MCSSFSFLSSGIALGKANLFSRQTQSILTHAHHPGRDIPPGTMEPQGCTGTDHSRSLSPPPICLWHWMMAGARRVFGKTTANRAQLRLPSATSQGEHREHVGCGKCVGRDRCPQRTPMTFTLCWPYFCIAAVDVSSSNGSWRLHNFPSSMHQGLPGGLMLQQDTD